MSLIRRITEININIKKISNDPSELQFGHKYVIKPRFFYIWNGPSSYVIATEEYQNVSWSNCYNSIPIVFQYQSIRHIFILFAMSSEAKTWPKKSNIWPQTIRSHLKQNDG